MTAPLRVGIVGAGRIAPTYLRLAPLFEHFAFTAIGSRNVAAAEAMGAAHGVAGMSFDALLARDDIDVVANMTPITAHDTVGRAILAAGKHLYAEKPLATSVAAGRELIAAASARNLCIGVAPDTMLGAGIRRARALIDAGAIGRVLGATGNFMADGAKFSAMMFSDGVGPVRELGPYYLSALVTLLGPVASVGAFSTTGPALRNHKDGPKRPGVETAVNAILSFRSGAQASVTFSLDVIGHGHAPLEIYGEEGTLVVPDPNFFGGVIEVIDRSGRRRIALDADALGAPNWPPDDPKLANYRGVGIAEMALAIAEDRAPRCSAELALHVLDVIEQILRAGAERRVVALETTAALPPPLDDDAARALLRSATR